MISLQKRPVLLIGISVCILTGIALCVLTIGSAKISATTVFSIISEHLFGISYLDTTSIQQTIVWKLRWQRVALAMIVGSGLAVAGVCFQTMFKNPLADPFILGVSSGAALGAAISIVVYHTEWMIPLAFSGAIISLLLVCLFSQRRGVGNSDQQLLLAGIACGSMLNAILSALMALHSQQMQMIVFWLMGSLTNYVDSLLPVLIVVIANLAVAMVYARDLDIMSLSDEDARFLGVDVDKVKRVILLSTTLVVGACVSVSGIIGFIGLIVPHLIRRIAGPEHVILLPLSAVYGAVFLLLADSLTRFFPDLSGIPVGVVTALFGSPFFLYVLYAAGRRSQ